MRRGLRVHRAPHGVYISAWSKSGNQVRFSEKERAWFTKTMPGRFPHTLFGGSEPERWVAANRSRLASIERTNEGRPGSIVGLESLDPDGRPLPARLADVVPGNKGRVPRALTWVRLQPGPPTRYITMAEVDLGGVRPDEVVVSYRVPPAELEQVRSLPARLSGDRKFFTTLPARSVDGLRVHCADLNLPITGASALDHFGKTIRGGYVVLESLVDDLESPLGARLLPTGEVKLSVKDSYLTSHVASVGPSGAKLVRLRAGLGADERSAVISVATRLVQGSDGTWAPARDGVVARALGRHASALRHAISPMADTLTDSAARLLSKLPR